MASMHEEARISAEERLREELDLRQALFDSIGEGIYVVDREGRLTLMNPVAEELLGWTAEELQGRSIHDAIHFRRADGSPFPAEECRLLAVARTGEAVRVEDDVFIRRDGSALPVAYSSHPLRRDGETMGAVVAFRDISAQKRREKQEHEARVRAEVLARARALPDSMRLDARAEALVHALAPGLADYAIIHIGDGEHPPRLIAVAHADPARERLVREISERYPPDPDAETGVPAVIRTGEDLVWREITPDLLAAIAHDEAHLALLRRLQPRSAIVLPLTARGRTIGALSLVSSSGRYSSGTVELAKQVAGQAALVLDNARLFAERSQAAQELQRALLPRELPQIPGALVAARYRPAVRGVEAGGDFFDVVDVGDGKYTLLIGDVAGKGPKAAALTGLVRHTVQGAVAAGAGADDVLTLANDALMRHGDLAEFCSAVYGCLTVEEEGVRIVLRCAGHPPPLHVGRDGQVAEVPGRGPLLGVGRTGRWPESTVLLAPGDLLVLYTDGAIELRGEDPYRGEVELHRMLGQMGGASPADVLERIEHHVLIANAGEPRDDLALLAVQAQPA